MSTLTIETIRDLVVTADRHQLCERITSLTEQQRQELASDALQLVSDIDKYWGIGTKVVPEHAQELIRRIDKAKYPDWRSPRWTSQLLVVGLCDCEPIKYPHKHNIGWLRTDLKDMQQRMLQILDARRPKWLSDWLKWEWKQEFPVPSWYLERGLIRSGALPANDSPEYYARMADDLQVIDSDFVDTYDTVPLFPSRRAMLEADPTLFEHDIWRLLQIDTSALRNPRHGWPDVLIELSQAGQLNRSRLLFDSLKNMTLPLSVKTLAGLVKFHEQLKPTTHEREQLVDDYLRLLHVGNSTVISMAVTALDKLQKEKRLPVKSFFENLSHVFLADKKSPAIVGIKLAMKVVKEYPNSRPQAAGALVAAMQHLDLDVQSAAVEGLSTLRDSIDNQSLSQMEEHSEFVAIAIRPALKKLISDLSNSRSGEPSEQTASKLPDSQLSQSNKKKTESNGAPPRFGSLRDQNDKPANVQGKATVYAERFDDIDVSIRVDSHLENALRAMQQGSPPIVLPVAKHVVPRRDPEKLVTPIHDLDELIASVSSIIEKVEEVVEFERILDGISRLHREKPPDFDKRVDPLRKQVLKRSAAYSESTLDAGMEIGLTCLITTWLDMEPIKNPRQTHWYTMRQWFLRERIYELERRVQCSKRGDAYDLKKTPVPTLALPTHRGGWIDPVVLVERLNSHYASQHVLIGDYDLAQAMLRLTPDGRRNALSNLGEPDHYNGNSELRYALGDNIDVLFNARHAIIQLAAVRARMISCAGDGYQPALPIAQASLGSNQRILLEGALLEDPTVPFGLMEAGFSFEPQIATVHDHLSRHRWRERWEAMTNPMDTDASCLAGHTSHLLDGEATWTPIACRVAVLAASHDRGEICILATDVMIEGINRLLIIPEVFGHVLAANHQHIKLNRVAKVLSDVAKVSSLHHWIVFRSLETCVCELPAFPNDVHLLLSQMLESAVELNAAPQLSTCAKLRVLEGKSKSGKLATQLKQLAGDANCQIDVHTAIIDATYARALRWKRITRNMLPA